MSLYRYTARTADGTLQRGEIESQSPSALRTLLQARGLRLLSVQAAEVPASSVSQVISNLNPFQWIPPRSLDIQVALEQLAVMLQSGLSLLDALRTVGEQASFRPMRRICESLSVSIQNGSTLADAMSEHASFPPIVVQLVRVGEATGHLDMVLERAARQIEQRRQNMTNLLTAMAYPAFVAVAAIGVAVYLVVAVIPELQKFLSAMGRKLPAMTQTLVDVSQWIERNGVTVLVLLIASVAGIVLVYLWPPGRLWMDKWVLRIPLIGRVLRIAATVTFSSSLGVMIRSGITVLDALRTVETLHANRFLRSTISAARESVIQGESLAPSLAVRYAYMPMLSSMVAVGERTGQMDDILDQVAKFHESQLQASIKRLSALIEPAIIVVVGGIVGYVYLSFFLALFSVGASPK